MQIGQRRLPHTAVAQGKHGTCKVNLQQQLLKKQGTNQLTCRAPCGSCSRLRASHYFSLEKYKWEQPAKHLFQKAFSRSVDLFQLNTCLAVKHQLQIILSLQLKRLQLVVSACQSTVPARLQICMSVECCVYLITLITIHKNKMGYEEAENKTLH